MASTATTRKSLYLKIIAHIGCLLTAIAWGTSFLSTKVLMEDGGFSPVEVYIYRFTLAYLLLLLLTLKKIKSNNWRDELTFIISGICAGSLYFVTENYALQNTTTGNVSLLGSVSPIFTTILMVVVYKQSLKFGTVLGSLIAFAGVGCVIFSHGESIEIRPMGDLLALGASMSWAVYTITIRRVIPHYNSLFITRKLFLYGVLSALPMLCFQESPYHIVELFTETKMLLNILFLVVFCSVVGYLIWNESMKILGAVTTNNYIYMQPLVTMVAAYFVFDEEIYLLGYIGCVLIIGGLIIADKMKK